MPPRFITLTIVVFWLTAMSWLFFWDILPPLLPGERPPFTIDLSQEARGPTQNTRWTLHRNGMKIGWADTWTTYKPREELYELVTKITIQKEQGNERELLKYSFFGMEVEIEKMETRHRVTKEGELRAVDAKISLQVRSRKTDLEKVNIKIEGKVEEQTFSPRWQIKSTLLGNHDFTTDPVAIHSHDSLLNPMQPWNRLLNVQKGQRWRMVLFDPLNDSMSSMLPGKRPSALILEAGVLEATKELNYEGNNVMCLIIEYRGEGLKAQTWVRESDGLVLWQEAERQEGTRTERLVLEREPPK